MEKSADFAKLPNPYDFAHPVHLQANFSGRVKELDDIEYYLDQALINSQPMNLALLGSRAAGKTSLLNIIELEAKKRGFCTVRVDLNEGDVETSLSFFFKLFDSLISSVCKFEVENETSAKTLCFGGKNAKTYQTYLDLISTYEVTEDRIWYPFFFPMQYAKALSRNSVNAKVSDHNFKDDLILIHSETKRPIIILFDECTVLTKNPILLQMLRNIFMNISGYMLVLAGTPELFPLMDEIFSPIVRQFKKIEVGAFEEFKDVEKCVKNPLESLQEGFGEILISEQTCNQLHNISGGKPYEIQLLCHFMFKKIQKKEAIKLELSLEVLDDVITELGKGQDVATRPLINEIRNLEKEEIAALSILANYSDSVSFDQIWYLEDVFIKTKKWTKEILLKHLGKFEKIHILEIKNNSISFLGDDFDKIYFKYYAAKKGISSLFESPVDIPFNFYFDLNLINTFNELDTIGRHIRVKENEREQDLTLEQVSNLLSDDSNIEDWHNLTSSDAQTVYSLFLDIAEATMTEVTSFNIIVDAPWLKRSYLFYISEDKIDNQEEIQEKFKSLSEKSKIHNVNLEMLSKRIKINSPENLVRKIDASTIKHKLIFSNLHLNSMIEQYLEEASPENALTHGEIAYLYNPLLSPDALNNYGYVLLANGNFERACTILNQLIEQENQKTPLPVYNLGVVNYKLGNYSEAYRLFKEASILSKDLKAHENSCAVLFVPEIIDGNLNWVEENDVNISASAFKAIEILNTIIPDIVNVGE